MAKKTLKPTGGKAWRNRTTAGVVVELPSGNVARIRSVGPEVYFNLGEIPDTLTPIVSQMFEGKTDQIELDTVEAFKPYMNMVNAICQAIMIAPKLVETPTTDDEIGFEHLEWADKQTLMSVIGATTKDIERFREKQTNNVEGVDVDETHGGDAK